MDEYSFDTIKDCPIEITIPNKNQTKMIVIINPSCVTKHRAQPPNAQYALIASCDSKFFGLVKCGGYIKNMVHTPKDFFGCFYLPYVGENATMIDHEFKKLGLKNTFDLNCVWIDNDPFKMFESIGIKYKLLK
jgi:hypothetical protein